MAELGTRPPLTVAEERNELRADCDDLKVEVEVLNVEITALHGRLSAALATSAAFRDALGELVDVKNHSDIVGKDDEYKRRQPLAWARARELLGKGVPMSEGQIKEVEAALTTAVDLSEALSLADQLAHEVWRQRALLNTPEIFDFTKAVQLEAMHQRERWGTEHDEGKEDTDWFWLIGWLAGKAVNNPVDASTSLESEKEKKLHRIITVAAAAANWHAARLGQTNMRPGIQTPHGEHET